MRITFKRVEIHNFMSFADETFDFDKHIGLNLICGKNNDLPGSRNGAGKSTLTNALCYALFGDLPTKIKNEHIHNKYVEGKDVRVIAYFDIENIQYKTVSGFNKYGAPYCQVAKIENGEEIDLTKSSIKESRDFIEKEILHCDMSIFLRTILLSSDQSYNFFRLNNRDKKEFVEKLFDISVFGDMYNAIHRDVLDTDKDIISRQNRLLVLNKIDEDYKKHTSVYEEEQHQKYAKISIQLEEASTKYDTLKNTEVKRNTTEVEKYEDAVNKITEAIDKVEAILKKVKDDNGKLEIQIHKYTTSKESKQKIIDKHSELLEKLCDDCKQIFKDYYNITKYINDIKTINENINKLQTELATNTEKINTYTKKYTLFNTKLVKANNKIKDLTKEHNETSRKLLALETAINSYRNELDKIDNAKNPYIELIEANKIKLDTETKELENITARYKYLKFAETIVSQDTLRKFIIKDLVVLLNNRIKMYLSKLGSTFSCIFNEDMEYTFITDGGEAEYANFSAGERARLTIAASFAFRDFLATRSNLTSNLLILDEYIDGNLDSSGIERILGILKDFIILYKQNIYIISHRKEIDNSIFNNIIQIQKTNNISKIAYLEM